MYAVKVKQQAYSTQQGRLARPLEGRRRRRRRGRERQGDESRYAFELLLWASVCLNGAQSNSHPVRPSQQPPFRMDPVSIGSPTRRGAKAELRGGAGRCTAAVSWVQPSPAAPRGHFGLQAVQAVTAGTGLPKIRVLCSRLPPTLRSLSQEDEAAKQADKVPPSPMMHPVSPAHATAQMQGARQPGSKSDVMSRHLGSDTTFLRGPAPPTWHGISKISIAVSNILRSPQYRACFSRPLPFRGGAWVWGRSRKGSKGAREHRPWSTRMPCPE